MTNSPKKYKDTLNLPNTPFPMKANLATLEPEIQQFFDDINIYQKIRDTAKNKPSYILHDGPPYANGNIHIGHALNKILKDIVLKYKTMQNFDVPYVPGWDCHGLPIEHQLLKKQKKSQHDVDQIQFRKDALDYSMEHVGIQREQFKRLGIFADWENPYLTTNKDYEKSIIESFIKLYQDGYIYKGLRPIHWCISCETALAEAEVEYAEHTSPSIYVKFKSNSDLSCAFKKIPTNKKTSFLIWTTTPWTLPANLAIAVKEDFIYVALETNNEILILAKDLVNNLVKETSIKDYTILDECPGSELKGLSALHPFLEREAGVILGHHVTLDQGTGCVHIAPGHGEDDFALGLENNLEIYNPVTNKGLFNNEVAIFKGMHVFKANELIIKHMQDNGSLLFHTKVSHSYPHCWRCKNPIIFRATKQWFLKIDHLDLRKNLIDAIKTINWFPQNGEHRISTMIANRPDWCLSRQRLWGVPIPIFYCANCGEELLNDAIIKKIMSTIDTEGIEAWFKKDVSDFITEGTVCSKCSHHIFIKETDILDVWFESGVSHQGVLKKRDNLKFPADLYLEGSDQHRGWFQTSLITSVALEKTAAFKTVLTHGFVVDGNGKKMSKSQGNVISPKQIIDQYGADILRLWVSSVDYSNDIRISDEILKQLTDSYRKIRNTFRFLLSNLSDFTYKNDHLAYENLDEIDKWALSKLQKLIKKVTEAYESFNFYGVYHTIYNFCIVEMSSFYLDILKDRLYTFAKNDPKRRSSQTVFFEILSTLTNLLAPILSFTTQEIWTFLPEEITKNINCIHLAEFKKANNDLINEPLETQWNQFIGIREDVSKALEIKRIAKEIKSSLEAKVLLATNDAELLTFLTRYKNFLPTIFIVSDVEIYKLNDVEKNSFSVGEENSSLNIKIVNADGIKCERCWNYSTTVNASKEHPTLCQRCINAINN